MSSDPPAHTHTPELGPLPAHSAYSRIPLLIRLSIINLQGPPTLSGIPPVTRLTSSVVSLTFGVTLVHPAYLIRISLIALG